MTDDASVTAAAETVGELDVLVNNAGISGGRISPRDATADYMRAVYETNVFGAVRVLRAFIPLLEKSPVPVVVNVSSGVGHNLPQEAPQAFRETPEPDTGGSWPAATHHSAHPTCSDVTVTSDTPSMDVCGGGGLRAPRRRQRAHR